LNVKGRGEGDSFQWQVFYDEKGRIVMPAQAEIQDSSKLRGSALGGLPARARRTGETKRVDKRKPWAKEKNFVWFTVPYFFYESYCYYLFAHDQVSLYT
jgi:hypothetical protein